jgi:hypothetical protein
MAHAVTSYKAYGIYRDEALTEKAIQVLQLTGTAANTDTAWDLGTYAGTFWNAVDATALGARALQVIKDVQTKAEAFLGIAGLGTRALVDASRSTITKIDSAVSAGGAAAETYTVTGLLTTDTILGVTQFVDGAAAAVGILDYGTAGVAAANNALVVTYNADPGAGAKVRVVVQRTTTTPDAGTYQLAMNATNTHLPDLTLASGDAPTTFTLVLAWVLKNGEKPVSYEE